MITCLTVGYAQEEESNQIHARGKVANGRVYLRWAPSNSYTWKLANQYGYTIARTKIMENGKLITPTDTRQLGSGVVKPSPLVFWEPFSENDYVGVAAQAIYGESFDVQENYSSDIARVINASRELENRFAFALYAVDMSPKAAELSGLWVVDQDLKPEEKYVYKIYANVPVSIATIDTASVFIGLADERPLPKPFDVKVQFDDQVALISWNAEVHQSTYNAYWVKRSADGINFESISTVPIVNTYADRPSERIYKGDSLQANGVIYYYQVIGIDAFGFKSPPSDIVDGTGLPVFKVAPTITAFEISDDQAVTLQWRVPQIDLNLLTSFSITRKSGRTGFTVPVVADLPADTREFLDVNPSSSNYYTVISHDDYGRKIASFPYMVQLDDSIPPVTPTGLQGSISEQGIVTLTWDENQEEDLRGYKIYKSNYAESSFVDLPGEMVISAMGEDSIYLNNLSEEIYYRVKAFDLRNNPSGFSETLLLEKPDLIPPVAPVFRDIKNDSLGILIQWENSPSEDMETQLLYRRGANESDWSLVYQQSEGMSFYLDQNCTHNTRYAYTLVAVDDDDLESNPADPVTMMRRALNPYPVISEFTYTVNQEDKTIYLNWAYSHPQVIKYLVYKKMGEDNLQLYKELAANPSGTHEYVDHYSGDTPLVYRVQAVFESGEKSILSNKVKVEF